MLLGIKGWELQEVLYLLKNGQRVRHELVPVQYEDLLLDREDLSEKSC